MSASQINLGTLSTLPATAHTALIAGWISALTAGETFPILEDTGTAGISVTASSANGGQTGWTITARDSGGSNILSASVATLGDFRTSGAWHTYAIALNTTTQTLQMLVDGSFYNFTPTSPGVTWSSTNAIAFFPGTDNWQIGPISGSGPGVDVSNFFFQGGGTFFDLSVAANQAKLFGSGDVPTYWGSDGSLVTGSQPQVYLDGNSATYSTNLGSGGSSSETGDALTDVTGPVGTQPEETTSLSWSLSFSVGGRLTDLSIDEWDGNFEIFDVLMPYAVTFRPNFAGSPTPGCDVAPASTVTLTFQFISAGTAYTLGTLTINGGSKTGVLATTYTPGDITIWPGQRLRMYAPANVDPTLVSLFGTILGAR